MANVNDIMRILDIDVALFNKADDKIMFVGQHLFAKFQFAVRNSVFKSELNLLIVTFILATLLFVIDPLGKKAKKEEPLTLKEEEVAKSVKLASIKKEESVKTEKKENEVEEKVVINGKSYKKSIKKYEPLDAISFDHFLAELRNPGFEVIRVKKDTPPRKKILRLNDDGMLYWSKDKVLGISKHQPWAPFLFKGSNDYGQTFTLKFASATNQNVVTEYELKVEPPLSDKIIQGLTDLATRTEKDKTFGKKIPSTPSKGKYSKGEANTTASTIPTVSPVKEETTSTDSPAKEKKETTSTSTPAP